MTISSTIKQAKKLSAMQLAQHVSNQKKTASQYINLLNHIECLVSKASITPHDEGCQAYITEQLQALGFSVHQFNHYGVSNLIATIGEGDTRIAFAGHTDVVPTGDIALWKSHPFQPTFVDDEIVGRGIADMKGGIAAMMAAIEKSVSSWDLNEYTFMLLITSDEEGEAEFGTKSIVQYLREHHLLPELCIVGEPSASKQTGDVIKIGRRGAISGELKIQGKQGHAAYPQYANNAAHIASDIASWLNHLSWDSGSDDFPGTSLQITSIDTGPWTDNIIPGDSTLCFNIRYSHVYNELGIRQRIEDGLMQIQQDIAIDWQRPCIPYFTNAPEYGVNLVSEVEQAIYSVCKRFPRLSTSGGTSDGRFIAETGCQVVEVGVPNNTIHQINERVKLTDLQTLQDIYQALLTKLMAS
ncbi:succinyl-diaminopimelate desuccinylase [Thalassotalea euphylliae]|uniref:succinyl-diaminopimelate desuccinylase n=1 Tax=Thalassotalea euphylliae TaxID=1655234 RepID=UPI003630A881